MPCVTREARRLSRTNEWKTLRSALWVMKSTKEISEVAQELL